MNELNRFAELLDDAALNARSTEQIAAANDISIDDAYEIQRLSIGRRIDRGEKLVGLKMGFTSVAKMEQMGVHDLIWGRLTDGMLIEQDSSISLERYVHPRAEPEIAFRISENIDKEVPIDEIRSICNGLCAAIEVIDSRYKNFKFSLEDVLADNCSSSGFVLGDWHGADVELNDIAMDLWVDDHVAHAGNSNAILGDPWKSLQAATRLAEKYQEPIKEGFIILAGAATAAEFLKQGNTIKTNVGPLGSVSFKVD